MTVAAVGSSTSTQQSSTSTSQSASLNYDSFLKLLTAQMQYQDPTNPMDATQFVAQLASFSNVEQAIKTNSKLDALLISQALTQVDGLIGKYVTSMDGKISGQVKEVHIYSNGTVVALDSGKELLLDAGVKISATPPAGSGDTGGESGDTET
ncbi:flagellar hook assembly protein FlgD [Hyphomicrobium sp.]|uniref:flagellar hook assembly protein FlgD n=1 Tax=Hyphomicrobium sp. TaxID=82 RepID=UPI0025BB40E0|nr:flagellar hook assembly protein FlgD [Hyphomicrobium sp.]MCC7253302.1 flagellar hook assembly protein FlgD [Hyphomicrobium sp.]